MKNIIVYDFKKTQNFSKDNIKTLQLICEEFYKSSSEHISYELKLPNLKITNTKAKQIKFMEFVSDKREDDLVIEFEIDSIVTNLILTLERRTSLIFIDYLLGGDGKLESYDRNLTDIDLEVLQHLIDTLLKKMYIPIGNNDINISDIFISLPEYTNIGMNDNMFIYNMEISIEEESIGDITLCFPYNCMKPILDEFVQEKFMESNNTVKNDTEKNNMVQVMRDVKLDISAILGKSLIDINNLLKIEEGDLIVLNQKVNEDICVTVGESEVYKCRIGKIGSNKGLIINDCIKRERE